MGKLVPALTAYDTERDRLAQYQTELAAKLRRTDDPTLGDLILDQQLATHQLLLAAEATLVTQLRALLPAPQAARARVILFTPPAVSEPARRGRNHHPDVLFPPGSPFAGPCDPFASMHGC